jgi:hypothetical protein
MTPLLWGCSADEFKCFTPKILHVSLKNADMKDLPWSVTSTDPVPCLAMICVAYALAQTSAVMSGIGIASEYLEKDKRQKILISPKS